MILNLRAKWDLHCKIREGEELLQSVTGGDSQDVETKLYRWRDNCGLVIKSYFGEDHFLFKDISNTGFGIGVMVAGTWGREVRRDNTASYRASIEFCLEVLRDCQKEIKDNGLIKHRVRVTLEYFAFFAVLLTLLVQVVLSFRSDEGPNLDSQSSQIEREMRCKQTRLDFEHRLWSFDDISDKELDSLKMARRQQGVFTSGEDVTRRIRFYEEKRRLRDYMIDSFLVVLSFQECDITQLSYSRKLPGNVGAGLIRWANSMDLDIRRYHVDTL